MIYVYCKYLCLYAMQCIHENVMNVFYVEIQIPHSPKQWSTLCRAECAQTDFLTIRLIYSWNHADFEDNEDTIT